jgi:hypothetical protein
VAGSIHHAVRSTAEHVAEDGEKLKENGGRVGLGVWSNGADDASGETVERGLGQLGQTGIARRRGGSRTGLLPSLVGWFLLLPIMCLMVTPEAEQLSPAALYVRKGWGRGPREACASERCHDSTLLRFRTTVEKSLVTPEKGDFIWLNL